ncbi:hypothetical protein [Cellulophaga baltica]|uniref:hypothetical protein n=1 Tax=Cellulophaga baltica TaxID=76594 RepID=UPI0012DDBF2F|nr:hypothetical protein [Cellulophaga baltica]
MERLGDIVANWLYQSRRELKLLFLNQESISTNTISIFLIVLFAIIPLSVFFLISGSKFSLVQIIGSYIFVVLLFYLSLVVVIAWYKSEELLKSNSQGFSFVSLSLSKIDAEFFGFDQEDLQNLLKLVNGLPVEQKIVIRETPRNKQSGNIRFLFTLLDLIVQGGVFRTGTKLKESLNVLIMERFTFQNSNINPSTLPSSYSKWCSATEAGSYDEVRKEISKALGML